MHQQGVLAGRLDAGDGRDLGAAHDDGVALHVSAAGGLTHHQWVEHLLGVVLRHAARHHLHAGVVAFELDLHVGRGGLVVVGEQLFGQQQLRARAQLGVGVAHGGGHAAQLDQLHLAGGSLVHDHVRDGVQDALARAAALAVVLLDVLHVAVLAAVERVDAVVLGGRVALVVDAAAGHDGHVAVLADVERVVHHVLQAGLRDDDGDEHRLALGAGRDVDVDAGVVRLGGDLDVRGRVALHQLPVLADVERAFRHAVDVGYLGEQALVDGGQVYSHDASSFLGGSSRRSCGFGGRRPLAFPRLSARAARCKTPPCQVDNRWWVFRSDAARWVRSAGSRGCPWRRSPAWAAALRACRFPPPGRRAEALSRRPAG